jgi:hypothetical protein
MPIPTQGDKITERTVYTISRPRGKFKNMVPVFETIDTVSGANSWLRYAQYVFKFHAYTRGLFTNTWLKYAFIHYQLKCISHQQNQLLYPSNNTCIGLRCNTNTFSLSTGHHQAVLNILFVTSI